MKIKNENLESIVSNPSYSKLFTTEFDDILIVLELRRQNEELKPALKAYTSTKKTLIERYCDKDPITKEPISAPNGQFSFRQNKDNLIEFSQKYAELLETEIDVDVKKVKIPMRTMNAAAKWSGADLSVLEAFIEIVMDDEKGDTKPTKLKNAKK